MALRCLIRTRTERTTLLPSLLTKSIKLFCTNFSFGARDYQQRVTKFSIHDPQMTPGSFDDHKNRPPKNYPNMIDYELRDPEYFQRTADDTFGCQNYSYEEAAWAVDHYNKKHNTVFVLARVLYWTRSLWRVNIVLEVKDGHVPHLYYVMVDTDIGSKKENYVLGFWMTLDRFQYESYCPYSDTHYRDLQQKNEQTTKVRDPIQVVDCEKDESGRYEDDVIQSAQFAVDHYNEQHNTSFVFVGVLKAQKGLSTGDMDIIISASDGHMPHVYYVTVKGEGSADKNKKKLQTWRTLDRLEYESTFPLSEEYVASNHKNTSRCRRCGFQDLDPGGSRGACTDQGHSILDEIF